jgi:hypothetical protein
MSRIQTQFNGITTTSPHKDGDFISLVNLRNKNGVLHLVTPRKIKQELSQEYQIIFIHKNNDYENWIGVARQEDNTFSIFWDIRNNKPSTVKSGIVEEVTGVEQIGNMVCVITPSAVYYLIYKEGKYVETNIPDLPAIQMRTMSYHAYRYFSEEYNGMQIPVSKLVEYTKGLVNKTIEMIQKRDATLHWVGSVLPEHRVCFFDAFFIRYAFRLYDGSLVKHSPPVLVMPPGNILEAKHIDYSVYEGNLYQKQVSKVDVYGYTLRPEFANYAAVDFNSLLEFKDIIQSIDIFISQPLGLSNIENIRGDMSEANNHGELDDSGWFTDGENLGDMDAYFSNPEHQHHYNLIKELDRYELDCLANNSTFYLVRSIMMDSDIGKVLYLGEGVN